MAGTAFYTVKVPGTLADHFEGTGWAQGDDASLAHLKAAWDASSYTRAGRGYFRTFTGTRTVLREIKIEAEMVLDLGGDAYTAAELKAAQTLIERVDAALKGEPVGYEAEPVVEVPAAEPVAEIMSADEALDMARDEDRSRQNAHSSGRDGALSGWADNMLAAESIKQRAIEIRGGWDFPALFDLDGNLVPAKLVDSRYGRSWGLMDEAGKVWDFFKPSRAKDEAKRRAADEAKGYREGRVFVPAKAELAGGSIGTVMAIMIRLDGGYSADARILDNGIPDAPVAPEIEETEPVTEPAAAEFIACEIPGPCRWDRLRAVTVIEGKPACEVCAERYNRQQEALREPRPARKAEVAPAPTHADIMAKVADMQERGTWPAAAPTEERKRVSNKRTTEVVHPDGTTSTRKSETMDYTHAIEAKEDMHAKAKGERANAAVALAALEALDRAVEAGSIVTEVEPWGRGLKGKRTTFHALDEVTGQRIYLGSETRTPDGSLDKYGAGEFNLESAVALERTSIKGRHAAAIKRAESWEAGPQFTYGVMRWSQSLENATKAMGEFSNRHLPTMTFRVVEAHEAAPKPRTRKAPAKAAKAAPKTALERAQAANAAALKALLGE